MNNKKIDVFIISYNRLSYLKLLIAWLEKAGFENIHIVDNNSTYPPLLKYFNISKYQVYRLDKNYGHLAVWECGKFKKIIDNNNYIVTDCDILPIDECPLNVTEYFFEILKKYPNITKTGFALKIDDLPEYYVYRDSIIDWEKQFWQNKIVVGLFDASIDTTFALYRHGIYPTNKNWWKSIRTDFPYIAKHLPWYANSNNPSEEEIYYQNNLKNGSSFWSVNDINLLKKYSDNLKKELNSVYSSKKWKILKAIYFWGNLLSCNKKFKKKLGTKKILSTDNITDIIFLQKYNRELSKELGIIHSSFGWKFFHKILNYFKLRIKN